MGAHLDPILSPKCLPFFAACYLGGSNPKQTPLASPLYGDFHGLFPLFLQAGDREIIRDDSIRVARKARQAGVDVTLDIVEEMIHVWHSQSVPMVPEGKAVVARVADFMQRLDWSGTPNEDIAKT